MLQAMESGYYASNWRSNLRSAIIVAATIPFALAFAILILVLQGESANLLSVSALDFGLVVDGAIVAVENALRRLAAEQARLGHPLTDTGRRAALFTYWLSGQALRARRAA